MMNKLHVSHAVDEHDTYGYVCTVVRMSVCVFISGISSLIMQPPCLGFFHWERVISVVTAIAVLAFCDCKWCEKRVKFECLKYSLKTKRSTRVPKTLATRVLSTRVLVSAKLRLDLLAWFTEVLVFQQVIIACIFFSTQHRSLAVALALLLRSFVSLWIVARCVRSYTKCVKVLWFAYHIEVHPIRSLHLIPCELVLIRTIYQRLNHPDGQALEKKTEDKELSKIISKRADSHTVWTLIFVGINVCIFHGLTVIHKRLVP